MTMHNSKFGRLHDISEEDDILYLVVAELKPGNCGCCGKAVAPEELANVITPLGHEPTLSLGVLMSGAIPTIEMATKIFDRTIHGLEETDNIERISLRAYKRTTRYDGKSFEMRFEHVTDFYVHEFVTEEAS